MEHIVRALGMPPGGGKTQIIADLLSNTNHRVFFAVPTHRLGEEILQHFQNISAQVVYGRSDKNCKNMEQVKVATAIGSNVYPSCCSDGKGRECVHFGLCNYLSQFENQPQVIIGAHQLLFHDQELLGKFSRVVIDESFYTAGFESWDTKIEVRPFEVRTGPGYDVDDGETTEWRKARAALMAMLDQHPVGVLQRAHLGALTVEMCERARKFEWKLTRFISLTPGMDRHDLARKKDRVPSIQEARRFSQLWTAIQDY